jgi:serine/threonine protein kinase
MEEKDKTGLYNDKQNNKTGIYNNAENKTGLYSEDTGNEVSDSQGIAIGDKLLLKNTEYTVKHTISKGTGEANVYAIEDNKGNLFALKLYFEFKDEAEEPNGIALERIQKLNDPDILKLIDFGIGSDKYLGKYCYEISDYALGGNILDVSDYKTKYTPSFIESEIIPQLYLAITKLHQYKIYHCDIKPGNILFKDKEQTDILIGDYGSAKAYDLKSEKALRKSTTIKGTEYYLAPEQARGIVSEKNDYYSFGMVLLHLLYPESFSFGPDFRRIDRDKFEQIIERQYNLKPIVDFNPKWKKMNTLIEGLTLINHINRWGFNEFEKWTKGEKVEVSYRTKGATDVKPFKTGPIEIYTPEEFINYIESKSTWYQDFFEDFEVYGMIKEWLDSLYGIPERKRFERVVDLYKLSGKPALLIVIKLFLLPHSELYIEGEAFDFNDLDKLPETVTRYIAKIDSLYKASTPDKLVLYFLQLEYLLNDKYYRENKDKKVFALLSKLYNPFVSDLKMPETFTHKTRIHAHIYPAKGDFNYEYLITVFQSFNENRPYPDNNGKPVNDLEELVLYYMKNKNTFNDKYHILERYALLRKFKSSNLIGYKLEDIVDKALVHKSEIKINIQHISFKTLCNVHYSIDYVLDSYLKQNGIDETITFKEDKGYIYADKNRLLAVVAANQFIKYLNEEHGGLKSWPTSHRPLRREFIKRYLKFFFFNRMVATLTGLFIIAVIIAIILRVFNLVDITF